MTAMKVMNRAPGFVPLGLRPISVHSPALAAAPKFRPAPYRPPLLANPPAELGQTFNPDLTPRAIAFGVLGGASLILSTVLPGAAATVATAAGIGMIGYGLYAAFSGPTPPPRTDVQTERRPLPEGQTRENVRVTAGFTYPPREGTVPQSLLGQYRLAFNVTNRGETPVDVIALVRVEEFTRITGSKGIQEKQYELRGIAPNSQKGIVDPSFPSSFQTGRHDAVATLYLQVANDHGGDVYASVPYAIEQGLSG